MKESINNGEKSVFYEKFVMSFFQTNLDPYGEMRS